MGCQGLIPGWVHVKQMPHQLYYYSSFYLFRLKYLGNPCMQETWIQSQVLYVDGPPEHHPLHHLPTSLPSTPSTEPEIALLYYWCGFQTKTKTPQNNQTAVDSPVPPLKHTAAVCFCLCFRRFSAPFWTQASQPCLCIEASQLVLK